ncbi:MAG: hypothetical protein J6Y78_03210 [Paludibacteraceae bacterium]|nr:hypothetical protein [Paludibacteraceae bacterium]
MEIKNYIGEVWRPVKGYEGLYEVSNYGRVRSLDRIVYRQNGNAYRLRGKIITPHTNGNTKHLHLKLCKDGIPVKNYVHRLEAEAFIPNPYNLPEVNHKDENPLNNFVCVNEDGTIDFEKSNLEWVSHQENNAYGTKGKRQGQKLSKGEVLQIKYGKVLNRYPSAEQAGKINNITPNNIRNCCNNKPHYKSAGGYEWRFAEDN